MPLFSAFASYCTLFLPSSLPLSACILHLNVFVTVMLTSFKHFTLVYSAGVSKGQDEDTLDSSLPRTDNGELPLTVFIGIVRYSVSGRGILH